MFCTNETYLNKDQDGKDRYLTCFVSIFDKLIVVYLSVQNTVSIKTPTGHQFGWFHSNIVQLSPNRSYEILIGIAIGYMLYDELCMRFVFKNYYADKITAQNSIHHYIVSLMIMSALFAGYAATSFVSIMFIVELSTLFLSLRDMHPTRKGCCYVTISLLFVIIYTVTRVIIFPYALFRVLVSFIGMWPHLDTFRSCCMVVGGVLAIMLQVLFLFWFTFIVNGIVKFAKGVNTSSSDKSSSDDEQRVPLVDGKSSSKPDS